MNGAIPVKNIKIAGYRNTRTISCPYCKKLQSVTLVTHLKRKHPVEWEAWTDEFVRLYNKTNDLKRVMRSFRNSEGELILSWTVIDSEIKKKVAQTGKAPTFNTKEHIGRWDPTPGEYQRFTTTVWDIPVRGAWGVHQSTYRGNWAPQVPRALIERYSKPGDTVLDPFVGGGTTLIEAWALGRNAIGYDVSDIALEMSRSRLGEMEHKAGRESLFGLPDVRVEIRKGDARRLKGISKESVDLVCAHPPYGPALRYTHGNPVDLSIIQDPNAFIHELGKAIARFYEVTKPGGVCAILLGDIRYKGAVYPLGFEAISLSRTAGFRLQEIVIKTQNKDRSTEFFYKNAPIDLRLNHEYLLILLK